jgi:glycosyltransferase involved in cell wall biosynthesis
MKILAATFAYNEGEKIRRTIARHPRDRQYDLLVMDDGSTDGALAEVPPGVLILRNPTTVGLAPR